MIATIRKRKMLLDKIVFQGQLVTEMHLIKKVIVNHFKQLYTKHNATKFNLSNLGLPRLSRTQSEELIREVTKEEIREALMSCNPTKAPGYDGFNIKCIKHVWSVIGDEFSSYILQFFASGYLPKAINTTWVTLIPKKKGAEDISDFRPISMVGCVYKVIAKILSRRLKEVMPDLIGPTQTTFVSGR